MNKSKNIYQSFGFAVSGLKFAYRYNRNLKIHLAVALLVAFLGLYLHIPTQEAAILVVAIVLVVTAEMINTVVEEVVNLITEDYALKAKVAKDVSAAMVLVTALGASVIGILVFLPYFFK